MADGTAEASIGISRALNGVVLLTASDQGVPQARVAQLRVPDWLPALVNATRVFIVIGVVELLWIATAWPSGALAVTWSAIFVITFSAAADQAYASAKSRLLGIILAAVLAAIVQRPKNQPAKIRPNAAASADSSLLTNRLSLR